jgi:hypothetical protein
MPADTNQYGDIFGGWLLGQMDIGGGIFAARMAQGRAATVLRTLYAKLGVGWRTILFLLFASLLGSYINIPSRNCRIS